MGQCADGHLELLCPDRKDGIVNAMPETLVGLGPDYLRLPVTAKATLRAKGEMSGDDLLAVMMQQLLELEVQVTTLGSSCCCSMNMRIALQVPWDAFNHSWKRRLKGWMHEANTCPNVARGRELVVEMAENLLTRDGKFLRSLQEPASLGQQLRRLGDHCRKHDLLSTTRGADNNGAQDNLMACVGYMSQHVVRSLREPVARKPCTEVLHDNSHLRWVVPLPAACLEFTTVCMAWAGRAMGRVMTVYAGLEPTLMALTTMRARKLVPQITIELWYVECDPKSVAVVKSNYGVAFIDVQRWVQMGHTERADFITAGKQGLAVVHVPDAHHFEVPPLAFGLVVLSPDCEPYSTAGLGEGKNGLRQMLLHTLKPDGAAQAHYATMQLQSALRITNAVALHNPKVRILLEEVVMGSSELGDPWRELVELLDFGFCCNLNAADVGGHSRARNFGSTHFIPPFVEAENEEGADWQDYLYNAVATAPKAHALTTVNSNRQVETDPSKNGQEGNAGIASDEGKFDQRSPYYNLVYCLLHDRWRPMLRVEAETLMGWPPGYTHALGDSAAKARIGKGIDVAVMMWVLMNWYTNLGPGLGGVAPSNKRRRLAQASAPMVIDGTDTPPPKTTAAANPYEALRLRNIHEREQALEKFGLGGTTLLNSH